MNKKKKCFFWVSVLGENKIVGSEGKKLKHSFSFWLGAGGTQESGGWQGWFFIGCVLE